MQAGANAMGMRCSRNLPQHIRHADAPTKAAQRTLNEVAPSITLEKAWKERLLMRETFEPLVCIAWGNPSHFTVEMAQSNDIDTVQFQHTALTKWLGKLAATWWTPLHARAIARRGVLAWWTTSSGR